MNFFGGGLVLISWACSGPFLGNVKRDLGASPIREALVIPILCGRSRLCRKLGILDLYDIMHHIFSRLDMLSVRRLKSCELNALL